MVGIWILPPWSALNVHSRLYGGKSDITTVVFERYSTVLTILLHIPVYLQDGEKVDITTMVY